MSLFFMLPNTSSLPVVSPDTSNVYGGDVGAGTYYAGIKFFADGTEYSTPASGANTYTTSRGNWLDKGSASGVWIQWTRTGGTLGDWNGDDAGDARVQMSSDRAWSISRNTVGSNTIIGNFKFYTKETGGTLLGSSGDLTFEAERVA